jgi:hypothetical protein
VKVLGPIELAIYACEYTVEKAKKRFVVDERYYGQGPETSSIMCDGISGESVLQHDLRASKVPNAAYLLGPLAGRRGCLPSRNDVLLQKQSPHPVMDYAFFTCGLLPGVLSEI